MTPTPTGIYNPVLNVYGRGVGAELLAKLIAQFLSIAFILGGAVLLAMLLWAGFEFLTAGGDPQKIQNAQKRIGTALVGFIILVGLRAILGFIASALEVEWLKTLKIKWPLPPGVKK